MKQALRENWEFLKQFRERFHTTGAVLPSSRFLARAMTQSLRDRGSPKRVLEVGPGRVLSNMAKRAYPDTTFIAVGSVEDLAGLEDSLAAAGFDS